VFSDDNTKAELFAPGEKSSIILERNKEGEPWIKADWSLEAWKGWILKKGDTVLYAGQ
jgi:hypothetical protein